MKWCKLGELKVLDYCEWGKMVDSGEFWGLFTLRACVHPNGSRGLALVHSRDKSETVVAAWLDSVEPKWLLRKSDGNPVTWEDIGLDEWDIDYIIGYVDEAI